MDRPSAIASRATAQYRDRDIVSYLALRLFLSAERAKYDDFIKTNVTQIVRGSISHSYHKSYLFKEILETGEVRHRPIYAPGAAEILAESLLISEIGKLDNIPNRDICFSYWISDENSRDGVFCRYMTGLRSRHSRIADVLEADDQSNVLYLDIENFYPSIKLADVRTIWNKFVDSSCLEKWVGELGICLIDRQIRSSADGELLIGPMFSHLLANLFMSEIDDYVSTLDVTVFRYVDDFVIIGRDSQIEAASEKMDAFLSARGLKLHPRKSTKSIYVTREQWLNGRSDFNGGVIASSWKKLVGDVKKLLVLGLESESDLRDAMMAAQIRLPLANYSVAVRENSTFFRIRQRDIWGWLFGKVRGVDADRIVADAIALRDLIESQIIELLESEVRPEGFERKRIVTKLRYRLGRALYLSSEEFLKEVSARLTDWPELRVHRALANAIVTKICDEIIDLGSNVAQSAAQLFKSMQETAFFRHEVVEPHQQLGVNTFILNGVAVDLAEIEVDGLFDILIGPITVEMLKTRDVFLGELASLHGLGAARAPLIMNDAFDLSSEVRFDATNFDYSYSL